MGRRLDEVHGFQAVLLGAHWLSLLSLSSQYLLSTCYVHGAGDIMKKENQALPPAVTLEVHAQVALYVRTVLQGGERPKFEGPLA